MLTHPFQLAFLYTPLLNLALASPAPPPEKRQTARVLQCPDSSFPAGATWQKPTSSANDANTMSLQPAPVTSLTEYCSQNQTITCFFDDKTPTPNGLDKANPACKDCTCPSVQETLASYHVDSPAPGTGAAPQPAAPPPPPPAQAPPPPPPPPPPHHPFPQAVGPNAGSGSPPEPVPAQQPPQPGQPAPKPAPAAAPAAAPAP